MFLFRRAFPSLSGGGSRSPFVPYKKGKRTIPRPAVSFLVKPKETWTHDFCLLHATECERTPSQEYISTLKEADLGKKRITFHDKNGDFHHLKDTLEQEYCKLKSQQGAFELMRAERGGASRPLKLISMPSIGYTVPYLKESIGSSTLVYIRPMKSNLPLDKVAYGVTGHSPLTKCPSCGEMIPIMRLRSHTSTCTLAIHVDEDYDDEKDLTKPVFDDDTHSEACTASSSKRERDPEPSTSSKKDSITIEDEPDCSSGPGVIDKDIASLKSIFPNEQDDIIREALMTYRSIEVAANALFSSSKSFQETKEEDTCKDVVNILSRLKDKMKSFLSAERLRVDEEDVVLDFLQYYKSEQFDPTVPITVKFRSQPGIDSGGVLRQAYTMVFQSLAKNEVPGLRLFTGVGRSEEHTSELQSRQYLVCRLLLEKKKFLFSKV